MLALIRPTVFGRGLPTLWVHGRSCGITSSGNKQSIYKGVNWHKQSGKWLARVNDPITNRLLVLGQHDREEDAAFAVDCGNLALRGSHAKTNLDVSKFSRKDIENAFRMIDLKRSKKQASIYTGVRRTGDKWSARIFVCGRDAHLGTFDAEVEAARAYDDALRNSGVSKSKVLRTLNFKQASDYFDVNTWRAEPVPLDASSRFLGVSRRRVRAKFQAQCGTKQLGVFESEVDAAFAFDVYSLAKGGPTNFHPSFIQQSLLVRGIDGATAVSSAISDPVNNATPLEIHTNCSQVLVRSTFPERQHTKEYTRKATASSVGKRREQPLVNAFCKQLLERGHELEARCYYDVLPSGEQVLLGRCDLYDRTTRTLYEAKSKADVPSVCMAIGQLMRYNHFERAGGGDASIGLALLLPSDDVKALSSLDRAFLESLRNIGIAVFTSKTM